MRLATQQDMRHAGKKGGYYAATGFRSVTQAQRDGRTYTQASGDYHVSSTGHRLALINQSREFYRDSEIYAGVLDRVVNYTIGTGFDLHPQTESETLNKSLEGLWNEFWQMPDVRKLQSGTDVEKTIARELFLCGDVASILLESGNIQVIESEQIVHPTGKGSARANNSDGLDKDSYGMVTRYWIAPYSPNGRVDTTASRSFDPADIAFVMLPGRPSQSRGVPLLQAAFANLWRIKDVCDSEAMAWQQQSKIALAITREGGPTIAAFESTADSDADSSKEPDIRIMDYGEALTFHGEPGDSISAMARNIPGLNFGEALRDFLRITTLPAGAPLEVVMLDWTGTNYSQSRAVLDQFAQTIIGWQLLIERAFHNRIYAWKVQEWIASQRIRVPRNTDPFKHTWGKNKPPWLDRLKEGQAYGQSQDRGWMTQADVIKSMNGDPDAVRNERLKEIQDAIAQAKQIEKATGEKVPWQLLCGLSVTPEKSTPEDDEEEVPANARNSK